MDTTFWNNIIIGRNYEEEVAQFFESQGFTVWRIGNFRLPIDLAVWDNKRFFCVEVKFRSYGSAHINKKGLEKFWNTKGHIFKIVIYPNHSETTIYKKLSKKQRREIVLDTRSSAPKHLHEEFIRKLLILIKNTPGIYGRVIDKKDYKEVNWDEVLAT